MVREISSEVEKYGFKVSFVLKAHKYYRIHIAPALTHVNLQVDRVSAPRVIVQGAGISEADGTYYCNDMGRVPTILIFGY